MNPAPPVEMDRTEAVNPLFAEVYERLKAMASRQLSRGSGGGLGTTELVHEAYLRIEKSNFRYENTAQFFSYAARAMRFILTDAARVRMQPKRGGDLVQLSLTDPAVDSVHIDPQLALQLDEALKHLERVDQRAAQVTELHYFAGLDMPQIASLLGIARRTAERDWRYARAFIATRADPGD